MFQHIFNDIYIVNRSSVLKQQKHVNFVDWFKEISHGNHWEEYRSFFPGMEYILKVTAAILGNGETILVLPDEDFNKFLKEYCTLLHLDDEAVNCMYIYSNACSLYSEGMLKYIDPQGVMYKNPIHIDTSTEEQIQSGYENFPLEFVVNCLDKEWARQAFEIKRSEAIFSTVKEIQFLAMRNSSMGPEEFKDISGNREVEAKKLLNASFRSKILDTLDRVGFNTESYRKPIELYVDEMPDYGIPASEPFRFNYLLAKHIKETGYRIDENKGAIK